MNSHTKCTNILARCVLPNSSLSVFLLSLFLWETREDLSCGALHLTINRSRTLSSLVLCKEIYKNLPKNYRPISNLPFLSKNPSKSRNSQTSVPSLGKQPQQPLSVSLSSRTQHQGRFVAYRKLHSLRSGR